MIRGVHFVRTGVARQGEKRFRLSTRPLIHDLALLHENDVVQKIVDLGLWLVNGAHDGALPALAQPFQRAHEGQCGGTVLPTGRLVKIEQSRRGRVRSSIATQRRFLSPPEIPLLMVSPTLTSRQ